MAFKVNNLKIKVMSKSKWIKRNQNGEKKERNSLKPLELER